MATDITMRTATPADYEGIIAVADGWWGRPVRRTLPRLFLDHFWDTSFVATDAGGSLAGFCVGFLSPAQRDTAYIQFAGVAPARRRTGLARTLYSAFCSLAASDGRSVVRAVTSPANTASVAFHTSIGFTVTGPVEDYDGPGSPMMVFERRLAVSDRTR